MVGFGAEGALVRVADSTGVTGKAGASDTFLGGTGETSTGGTSVVTGAWAGLTAVAGCAVTEGSGVVAGAGGGLSLGSAVAVEGIGEISTGLGGLDLGEDPGRSVSASGRGDDVLAPSLSSRIRVTISVERPAKVLLLTSKPHFWIRSSNS